LDAIDDIQVEMNGTPFQKRVWEALRHVPAGRTATYSEIAAAIGSPAAVRAVGAANGANPVAVVVPCHRIIGSNGTLTGYGGGLKRKEWLLRHERTLLSGELFVDHA
jgi:methylated-DNA-[protein]-cysteine S-methyltransferase